MADEITMVLDPSALSWELSSSPSFEHNVDD